MGNQPRASYMVTAAALQLLPQRYPECARVQDARRNAGRHLARKLKGLAPLDRMTLHLLSGIGIVYLITINIIINNHLLSIEFIVSVHTHEGRSIFYSVSLSVADWMALVVFHDLPPIPIA